MYVIDNRISIILSVDELGGFMLVTINRVEGYSEEHWRGSSYYWITQYMDSPNAIYSVDKIETRIVDIDEEYLMSGDLEELAFRSYYGEII